MGSCCIRRKTSVGSGPLSNQTSDRYESLGRVLLQALIPEPVNGDLHLGSTFINHVPGARPFGIYGATDTRTGKVFWKIRIAQPAKSGVLVAGDLVFFGEGNGNFAPSMPGAEISCLRTMVRTTRHSMTLAGRKRTRWPTWRTAASSLSTPSAETFRIESSPRTVTAWA